MSVSQAELGHVDPPEWDQVPDEEYLKNLGGVAMSTDSFEEPEAEADVQAETVETLLERYEKPTSDGWLVRFHELPEGVTAYNASQAFDVDGIPHMFVREEGQRADEEFTSRLSIWRLSEDGKDCWPAAISNLSELTKDKVAQDPSYSYVNGKHVVTWVEVELDDPPDDPTQPRTFKSFKSVAATGERLDKLERLAETVRDDNGQEQMRNIELPDTKGLRFVGLSGGRIGVSTRTTTDGEYKMRFAIANSWNDITTDFLAAAKEIEGLEGLVVNNVDKYQKRWTGPNDMEALANDDISLVMHAGMFVDNGIPDYRVYDAVHCILVPGEGDEPAQAMWPKIIARANDFNIPEAVLPSKRPDVAEVAYPSGHRPAVKQGDETILWAGLRDAGEVGQMVPDVLKEWREAHPDFADNPFPQSIDQDYTMAA